MSEKKKRGSGHRVAAFLSTLECVLGKQPLQRDVICRLEKTQRPTTVTSDAIQPKLLIAKLIICGLSVYLIKHMLIVPEPCPPSLQLSMWTANGPAQKVMTMMAFLSEHAKEEMAYRPTH